MRLFDKDAGEALEAAAKLSLQQEQSRQSQYAPIGYRSHFHPDESSSDDDDDDAESQSSHESQEPSVISEEPSSNTASDNNQEQQVPQSLAQQTQAKKKRLPAASMTEHDRLVQKMGTPPLTSFPMQLRGELIEETTNVVQVPTVLLTKDEEKGVCRSLLELHKSLETPTSKTIVVLLLRSGRFAGAVFQKERCVAHRTCQRYTTRKGQGGSQSANDNSKNSSAKSVGAQLRRAGEEALRQDVQSALTDWSHHISNAAVLLVSIPKVMRKGFYDANVVLSKTDPRLRSIPLDFGRPTFQSVSAVYESLTTLHISQYHPTDPSLPNQTIVSEQTNLEQTIEHQEKSKNATQESLPAPKKESVPLTPLHEAASVADLDRLIELLKSETRSGEHTSDLVDMRAGEMESTPLHLASLSSSEGADACVMALLMEGHANPCVVDSHGRPPYFVASTEKVRQAYRKARDQLGEGAWEWDTGARVGPPLTSDDVALKKQKAAEKKRRQRARQKERATQEKAQLAQEEAQERETRERAHAQELAKRIRDGLPPKTVQAANACDFCQLICKGKRPNQMFQRLDYKYCSTDCVKKHQRELAAKAAMARLGGA